jgi:hypothetical protein
MTFLRLNNSDNAPVLSFFDNQNPKKIIGGRGLKLCLHLPAKKAKVNWGLGLRIYKTILAELDDIAPSVPSVFLSKY